MPDRNAPSGSDELLDRVGDCLADCEIMRNPYFTDLSCGEMSLSSFRRSQQQFYFAVEFFSRPMSALMMRLPTPQQRLGILENIVEEHGSFRCDSFHEATFRQFLASIEANSDPPSASAMRPAVHAFNATILSACLSDHVTTGIACLGIIEYAFADISALIANAVVQRDWVRRQDLVHYKLHAEIDKQHAADFFALIASDWNDSHRRIEIEQGLRLGAYVFDRLYRDLREA